MLIERIETPRVKSLRYSDHGMKYLVRFMDDMKRMVCETAEAIHDVRELNCARGGICSTDCSACENLLPVD